VRRSSIGSTKLALVLRTAPLFHLVRSGLANAKNPSNEQYQPKTPLPLCRNSTLFQYRCRNETPFDLVRLLRAHTQRSHQTQLLGSPRLSDGQSLRVD